MRMYEVDNPTDPVGITTNFPMDVPLPFTEYNQFCEDASKSIKFIVEGRLGSDHLENLIER